MQAVTNMFCLLTATILERNVIEWLLLTYIAIRAWQNSYTLVSSSEGIIDDRSLTLSQSSPSLPTQSRGQRSGRSLQLVLTYPKCDL